MNYHCREVKSPFAYFIKTARNAAEDRYRIRRQFGLKNKNYFFMLGTNKDGNAFETGSGLDYERMLYDDIVVGDFIDTYDNLPYKTRSIYHFIRQYCTDELKVLVKNLKMTLRGQQFTNSV